MGDSEQVSQILSCGYGFPEDEIIKSAGPYGCCVYLMGNHRGECVTVLSLKNGEESLTQSIALDVADWVPCDGCMSCCDPYVTGSRGTKPLGHWQKRKHPLWPEKDKQEQENG